MLSQSLSLTPVKTTSALSTPLQLHLSSPVASPLSKSPRMTALKVQAAPTSLSKLVIPSPALFSKPVPKKSNDTTKNNLDPVLVTPAQVFSLMLAGDKQYSSSIFAAEMYTKMRGQNPTQAQFIQDYFKLRNQCGVTNSNLIVIGTQRMQMVEILNQKRSALNQLPTNSTARNIANAEYNQMTKEFNNVVLIEAGLIVKLAQLRQQLEQRKAQQPALFKQAVQQLKADAAQDMTHAKQQLTIATKNATRSKTFYEQQIANPKLTQAQVAKLMEDVRQVGTQAQNAEIALQLAQARSQSIDVLSKVLVEDALPQAANLAQYYQQAAIKAQNEVSRIMLEAKTGQRARSALPFPAPPPSLLDTVVNNTTGFLGLTADALGSFSEKGRMSIALRNANTPVI
jgi:hypothetical protein